MRGSTLLTGAGGYVGRLLSDALDRAGHDLVLVDRAFPPHFATRMARHDVRQIDVADAARVDDMPPLDFVIHAAAVTADPGDDATAVVGYLREHLEAALAMIELAGRHDARLMFVSSAGVFAADQTGALHEGIAPHGRGAYAAAKRMTEIAVMEAARAGADALVVRLGNLYGGDERPGATRPRVSVVQRMVDEAVRTREIRVEHASEVREWTAAPDIARLMPDLLEMPIPTERILHLASPETLSRREVAHAIARHLADVRIDVVSEASPPIRGPLASRNPIVSRLLPEEGWTPFERGVGELLGVSVPERSPVP